MRPSLDRPNQGFTLIELVIVISLIGIMSGLAIPRYFQIADAARDGALKHNLGQLRSALTVAHAFWIVNGLPGAGPLTDPVTGHTIRFTAPGWPALLELQETGLNVGAGFMGGDGNFPDNPWSLDASKDDVGAGATSGIDWVYNELTGEIRAATQNRPTSPKEDTF